MRGQSDILGLLKYVMLLIRILHTGGLEAVGVTANAVTPAPRGAVGLALRCDSDTWLGSCSNSAPVWPNCKTTPAN